MWFRIVDFLGDSSGNVPVFCALWLDSGHTLLQGCGLLLCWTGVWSGQCRNLWWFHGCSSWRLFSCPFWRETVVGTPVVVKGRGDLRHYGGEGLAAELDASSWFIDRDFPCTHRLHHHHQSNAARFLAHSSGATSLFVSRAAGHVDGWRRRLR